MGATQPTIGIEQALRFACSPEATHRITVSSMRVSDAKTQEHGRPTFEVVEGEPGVSIPMRDGIIDLARFILEASDSSEGANDPAKNLLERMRDGIIILPPGYYDNFYSQVYSNIQKKRCTLLVNDDSGHSANYLTAGILRANNPPIDEFQVVTSQQIQEIRSDELVYIDDWCVTGTQLRREIENCLNICPKMTISIHLMAANSTVLEELSSQFPSVKFVVYSTVEPNEEVAGFGYNGSVSWGYENTMGSLIKSFGDVRPPLIHYVHRPYKTKSVSPSSEAGRYYRRRETQIRIGRTLNKYRLNSTGEDMEEDTPIRFLAGTWHFLSNFSAFRIDVWGRSFPTAEHAYQWAKFKDYDSELAERIAKFGSAVEAKKCADFNSSSVDPDWNNKKLAVMMNIIDAKIEQYPWVREKLRLSNNRELVEDSPTDLYWGRDEHGNGLNMLGKIWMDARCRLTNDAD